jgi:hypothetical protein
VLAPGTIPGRAELRLLMRPMGSDVLQDLVDSGDLDAGLLKEVPTFTMFSATLKWNENFDPTPESVEITSKPDCDRFRCLLDPKSPSCDE